MFVPSRAQPNDPAPIIFEGIWVVDEGKRSSTHRRIKAVMVSLTIRVDVDSVAICKPACQFVNGASDEIVALIISGDEAKCIGRFSGCFGSSFYSGDVAWAVWDSDE